MTTASREVSWPYTAPRVAEPCSPPRVRSVPVLASADEALLRPVHAADMAQARLFDDMLRCEIAELEELAESAQRRWLLRREDGVGDDKPPAALLRMHDRVAEAHALLDALRLRFALE